MAKTVATKLHSYSLTLFALHVCRQTKAKLLQRSGDWRALVGISGRIWVWSKELTASHH
jgi:hypothetical protein